MGSFVLTIFLVSIESECCLRWRTRGEDKGIQNRATIFLGFGIGQFLEHPEDTTRYIGVVEIIFCHPEEAGLSHGIDMNFDH